MKCHRAVPLLVCIVAILAAFTVSDHGSPGAFRDLNKNGQMDVYEDVTRPLEERVGDLLGQMTLEEKAGLMFINGVMVAPDASIDGSPSAGGFGAPVRSLLIDKKMNSFNIWAVPSPLVLARWYNNVQQLAESTRLGIPVTIASDPRHAFESNRLTAAAAGAFSAWPEPLGLAAIGDTVLTYRFADIARQEYLATGIRLALHPMADLATEPRWPRISGTFGEDAALAAAMTRAYIRGFQGSVLGPRSVATMTKHFSGGGPQKEGLDSHFDFHKGQVYPGNNFAYHLIPFEAAFKAGTAQIMPYYGVPMGQTSRDVAFAFNRDIITGLLREKYRFEGVVTTDWGVITDSPMGDYVWKARAWGVEHLTPEQRVAAALDAGVDQFGGESVPEFVVSLVKSGQVPESRIDASVRRILRDKFRLGLFDNPYIDVATTESVVGNPDFRKLGEQAQRRSMVLLKNGSDRNHPILPLQGRKKLYVRGMDTTIVAAFGDVVTNPGDADVAILRLRTPFQSIGDFAFAQAMHHGDLDFKAEELQEILGIMQKVPTIVDLYLDRPAVVPEVAAQSAALLGNFGASDAALLDVLFGKTTPEGKLPFELPSSMDAVRNQKEDLPYDSVDPLFPFGFGLRYASPRADVLLEPVRVAGGLVTGIEGRNAGVRVFKGIPFAAPPVGDMRWKAPEPVTAWEGVRKADHFGAGCLQGQGPVFLPWTEEFLHRGPISEDCLYLNVWTTANASSEKLPVLVYIHGGAFTEGSGSVPIYDGEALAQKGLVVVTVNYRLGAFGFMAHPALSSETGVGSGNYGLMDQVAALRWVHDHIDGFGGDPANVTIAGQSAGAMSVYLLTAVPSARGLFHRAIVQSGPGGLAAFGLTSTAMLAGPLKAAEVTGNEVATALKATTLAELRSLPAAAVLAHRARYGPVVDGHFLPEDLDAIYAAGKQNDVPMLTGLNADEGSFMQGYTRGDLASLGNRIRERMGEAASRLLEHYPAKTDAEAAVARIQLDREVGIHALHRILTQRARTAQTPAYSYFMDRAIPWPDHPEFGAFHTGEVPYVFGTFGVLNRPWDPADHLLHEQMARYWANFARSGDPNGPGLPEWPRFDPARGTTMVLGRQSGARELIGAEKAALLDAYLKGMN